MIKNGRLWPWALGSVLGMTVIGNLWVMKLAGSDAALAVEPDYYQKALNWDSTMNQQRINQALGWSLESSLSQGVDGSSQPTIEADLKDASGDPIDHAAIIVEATHNARAGEIIRVELAPLGGGKYRAILASTRQGLWQLRFEVRAAGERFTAVRKLPTLGVSTGS